MNRLKDSPSPYLQQHAQNPIDWHPWDTIAWDTAHSGNKLVVVSIGYSTCHWCHVMAHEVFEDSAVAEYQNRNFVSIKVDREERPDLDKIYMDSCRVLTGQGGWPLNVICLPDGRPVQACTYLPKEIWIRLLGQIHLLWLENPERLHHQASAVADAIQNLDQEIGQELSVVSSTDGFRRSSAELFREVWSRISGGCDTNFGGFSGAPKFPVPVFWESLLEIETHDAAHRQIATTLDSMAVSGLFDQIGGGFFRYSTDEQWHIPHFEKMLYDNAQLLSLYARSLRTVPSSLTRRIIRQTVEWMQHSLQSPEGLWYSALNADTDGVEGATYVWTQEQMLASVPDSPLVEDYLRTLDIHSKGNWENGLSHPRLSPSLARDLNAEESYQALQNLDEIRSKLLEVRNQRSQPSRDHKIILEWNALAARGFLDAGRALADIKLVSIGLDTLDALLLRLRGADGEFHRTLCQGTHGAPAFLSDLACLTEACLIAHETTLVPRWLQEAEQLASIVLERFSQTDTPFLSLAPQKGETLFANPVELNDDVIPSSNSVFARVLLRLGRILEKQEWIQLAEKTLHAMRETSLNSPRAYPNWVRGLFELLYPAPIVKIQGAEAQRWAREVWMIFPRCVVTGDMSQGKATTATVCGNSSCLPAVHTLKELLEQIGSLLKVGN